MFLKAPTHRQFNYRPRYYDPEVDETNGRRRIKFHRITKHRPVQRRPIIFYIIVIGILIYLLYSFNNLVEMDRHQKNGTIRVEEIIIED